MGREKEKEKEVWDDESRATLDAHGGRRGGYAGRHVPLLLVTVATSPKVVVRGRGRS